MYFSRITKLAVSCLGLATQSQHFVKCQPALLIGDIGSETLKPCVRVLSFGFRTQDVCRSDYVTCSHVQPTQNFETLCPLAPGLAQEQILKAFPVSLSHSLRSYKLSTPFPDCCLKTMYPSRPETRFKVGLEGMAVGILLALLAFMEGLRWFRS